MAMLSFPILRCSVFLLFSLLIHQFPATTAARCHRDDETGLLAFKSGIKADPTGMLDTWKLGTDCCKWYGIDCNGPQNRVNSLYLYGEASYSNRTLSGTISPSLSKLQYLNFILFRDLGNLTGPFPRVLFSLPNIEVVLITNSKLLGPLPRNIGNMTTLKSLVLARNRFSGSIPSSLTKLTQLTELDLSGNRLLGTIPSSIGQLTKLFELNLSGNQLSGSIPDNFSTITMLTFIKLSNNNFTGKFPKSIANLNSMEIDMGSNCLTGKLPEFNRFGFLKTLNLSWNQFSGSVPKSLGIPEIYTLDLSHNLFNGPFPKLTFIHILDLSYNNFHFGDIPKWITSTNFISLKLAKCGLNISLNDWKPKGAVFYQDLDISHNKITGNPLRLLNSTTSLISFIASDNKLKFNMKHMKIGKNIKYLDLSHNSVFGIVPKYVSRLEEFNVSYNHLCGRLPVTKFPASAFVNNDCLCGPPLPPCKD